MAKDSAPAAGPMCSIAAMSLFPDLPHAGRSQVIFRINLRWGKYPTVNTVMARAVWEHRIALQ
jgi:hypothetical protein